MASNLNTTETGNLQLSPSQEKSVVAFLRTISDGFTPTAADLVSASGENLDDEPLNDEKLDDSVNPNYQLFLPILTKDAP